MRIFKSIHQFLPKHVAGSEVHTYLLCKELMKRHDVHLFYPEHYADREPYQVRRDFYDGIPVTEFSYSAAAVNFEETYRNPRIDEIFLQAFEAFNPDLYHIQHLFFLTPNLIRLARRRGVPVVMTLHEYGYQCPAGGLRMRPDYQLCDTIRPGQCADCLLESPYVFRGAKPESRRSRLFKKTARLARRPFETSNLMNGLLPRDPLLEAVGDRDRVMRECLAEVDLFLAPSRYLLEKYREWGVPSEKLLYLDYGFDVKTFRSVQRESSAVKRFAFIGSVMPHKGVDVLVDAFNRLPHGGVELRIYGEPSYHPPFYKELKARASHPGIRFEGFLPADKVAEAYRHIDALIVPSRWFENSPLTIHEALLAGVPVITSDLGGMKELITPGVNGLLFRTGDAADLCRALTEFLAAPGRFEPEKIRHSLPIIDFTDYVAVVERHYERLVAGCRAAKSAS